MYASQDAPVMTAQEEPVCLRAVSVRAKVHDLLSQTRVTQVYENSESGPIETVYTFPLPVDGVLTGVEVKIGERELFGRAVEKRAAEQEYEECLVKGDSPVMLERLESGLYTLNVGNLFPASGPRSRWSLSRCSGSHGERSATSCLQPSASGTAAQRRWGLSLIRCRSTPCLRTTGFPLRWISPVCWPEPGFPVPPTRYRLQRKRMGYGCPSLVNWPVWTGISY